MKFSSALFITVTAFLYANVVNSKEGETWAVLIVGYDYYRFTYGFEVRNLTKYQFICIYNCFDLLRFYINNICNKCFKIKIYFLFKQK